MPIYEYITEAPDNPDQSCFHCRKKFELKRTLDRSHELDCPICKNPLKKLISRVSQTKKEGFSADKAKKAGFTILNNTGDGTVEKE